MKSDVDSSEIKLTKITNVNTTDTDFDLSSLMKKPESTADDASETTDQTDMWSSYTPI